MSEPLNHPAALGIPALMVSAARGPHLKPLEPNQSPAGREIRCEWCGKDLALEVLRIGSVLKYFCDANCKRDYETFIS